MQDNFDNLDSNLEDEEKKIEGTHKLEPEKTTRKERAKLDENIMIDPNNKCYSNGHE